MNNLTYHIKCEQGNFFETYRIFTNDHGYPDRVQVTELPLDYTEEWALEKIMRNVWFDMGWARVGPQGKTFKKVKIFKELGEEDGWKTVEIREVVWEDIKDDYVLERN